VFPSGGRGEPSPRYLSSANVRALAQAGSLERYRRGGGVEISKYAEMDLVFITFEKV